MPLGISETRCGTTLALEIIPKELSADGRAVTRRYRIQRTPSKWGGQEIPRDRIAVIDGRARRGNSKPDHR